MVDIQQSTSFGATGSSIPEWASGTNYVADQQRLADGDVWKCKLAHLSAASNWMLESHPNHRKNLPNDPRKGQRQCRRQAERRSRKDE